MFAEGAQEGEAAAGPDGGGTDSDMKRRSVRGLSALSALRGEDCAALAAQEAKPSAALTTVVAAVCLMLGEAPLTWATAQRVLRDRRLPQRLLRWDVAAFAADGARRERLGALLARAAAEAGAVRAESAAAGALQEWAVAMEALAAAVALKQTQKEE
eukprot:g5640.t1